MLRKLVSSFKAAEAVSRGIDLTGRRALVTGANSGIGQETARVLALRGAHVVMACRDQSRADAARRTLIAGGSSPDRLETLKLDLGSLDSVAQLAEAFHARHDKLDLLINNAGVVSPVRAETVNGFELHFGTNHLGHFLLTHLLMPALQRAPEARVVNLSSDAMHLATTDAAFSDLAWKKRPYKGWVSYGDSKLMNLLFTQELAARVAAHGITAHAVHPGVVMTGLVKKPDLETTLLAVRALPQMRGVGQGAATSVFCAVGREAQHASGGYWAFCLPNEPAPLAKRPEVARTLWKLSEDLLGARLGPTLASAPASLA